MPKSETFNMDCLEAMRQMPDKAFDLCLTDPPYNVGIDYNGQNDKRSDYREWCVQWFAEASRVSRCVVFTPGVVNLADWIQFARPFAIMSWFKPNQCSPSILRGFNVWEPILVYGENKYQIPQDGILESITMQRNAAFHPCPKSLRTWAKLLRWFARPGDTVLDIFLGSGTTRIAAWDLGFDFTGYELDPDYFREGNERFERHRAQGNLFTSDDTPKPTQGGLFTEKLTSNAPKA
ncbi:MAG: site-specific DNA-methyltransferase [Desulfurellales bacterium]|nr:MAG: site-specific DNA-methyltransferase [Desulfurellales bacterium]